MPMAPITVPRDLYRGADPSRLAKRDRHNLVAGRIEDFIAAEMEKHDGPEPRRFSMLELARAVREDLALVERIAYGIDCSYSGVTVWPYAASR